MRGQGDFSRVLTEISVLTLHRAVTGNTPLRSHGDMSHVRLLTVGQSQEPREQHAESLNVR